MTIDEAIEHAEEVARTCEDERCAADHMQLAEWLSNARDAGDVVRWLIVNLLELLHEVERLRSDEAHCIMLRAAKDKLEAENAKLRELASEAWELLTCNEPVFVWSSLLEKARELGIEVDE